MCHPHLFNLIIVSSIQIISGDEIAAVEFENPVDRYVKPDRYACTRELCVYINVGGIGWIDQICIREVKMLNS